MRADEGRLKSNNKVNIFVVYTLLFCIFTAGIFAALILSHRSFMQYHDAYRQGAFRLIEIQNQIHNILNGEGFSWWSWYEGTGLDESMENFVDPFSIIASFFPMRYLELGFTAAALMRMYFGGIAFIILGRETGLKRNQILIGAILYVFSACFIGLALRQSENLKNIFIFPLLITGTEKIYKGKSPAMFIVAVAYYMLTSFYFSYMSGIMIILYIVLRYFAYNDRFRFGEFASSLGKFIGFGIVGIMIPAFSWLFSASSLVGASTVSTNAVERGLIPDADTFMSFGKILLGTGATYDYQDIGLCILVIMLMPLAVRHCSIKRTNILMMIILFAMLLSPFFCSMFNGFSYASYRWSYAFTLFAVWSAVEQFDIDTIREKGSLLLAALGLCLIGLWTAGLYKMGKISLDHSGKYFVVIQLAAGIVLLGLLLLIKRSGRISRGMTVLFILIPLISLSAGWYIGTASRIENFARNSSVHNNLEKSTLRVGSQIEDEGFYRIDSVDGIFRHAELTFPVNENIWWKTNNIFIYNSRIPETLTAFNIELGNSYGYVRRVFMESNGNRMGLDFLYGVRYFLGSDSKNPETFDSDNYAAYGFEKDGEIDGVTVFKSKYEPGLGFVLDKAVTRSEFDKLGRLAKEQALLQAAVIPDDEAEECSIPLVKADELDIDITDIPYEITGTDGAVVEDGRIITEKGEASFTMKVRGVPDSQLVVSFDRLRRNAKDAEDEGGSYYIYADNGTVESAVRNQHSRQGIPGLINHDLNMGHCEGDYDITITLPYKGTYTFDRLYVSAMSTSNYDRYASQCTGNRLTVSEYDNDSVEGTTGSEKDGILFLSIPDHENWDVYVDGDKAEEINDLDTTFLGAYVPGGEHEITLKYSNMAVRYGSIISIAGVIAFILVLIKTGKKKRYEPTHLQV